MTSPVPDAQLGMGIREIMRRAADVPDVVHLEGGIPALMPPHHVLDEIDRAQRSSFAGYAPTQGFRWLRQAISDKVLTVNGYAIDPDDVVVTPGAGGGIALAALTVLQDGASLLVPDPGWPNYRLLGPLARVAILPYPVMASGEPALDTLVALFRTHRVGAMIINSPSNPTGRIIPPDCLESILSICEDHDAWIISDETYDEVVFHPPSYSPRLVSNYERLITVYSLSKSHCMAGFRMGYAVFPSETVSSVCQRAEALFLCAPTAAQYGARAAIERRSEYTCEVVSYSSTALLILGDILQQHQVPFAWPDGGIYLWADVSAICASGTDLAQALLTEEKVAVVPGEEFGRGGAGFVRLAASDTVERVAEGAQRLDRFLSRH